MKKLFSIFALLMLSVGLWALDNVPYRDANGEEQTVNDVTEITNSSSTLTAGWYVVTGTDVQTGTLVCNGVVRIILADGAKLTAKGSDSGYTPGIRVSGEGNVLYVYGQTDQTGQLVAQGGFQAAGIGGGNQESGSYIRIYGGKISASGGDYAAGIGGGSEGSGYEISFRGNCCVTATGQSGSAGIGGGYKANGSEIRIYSGNVTAIGGTLAAGIGGGYTASGTDIAIEGGKVFAAGGDDASGIGGGMKGSGRNITVDRYMLVLKADNSNPPTKVIANNGADLAASLDGRQFVTVNRNQPLGGGTKDKPYLICSYEELLWFSNEVKRNNPGACARLGADIDATGSSSSWIPIGTEGKHYTGVFDGNGHVINKLEVHGSNLDSRNNIGLFGKIGYGNDGSGSEVCNLGITNGYFMGDNYVGAICGDFAYGTIRNCYVVNTFVSGSGDAVGSIVGSHYYSGVLEDCYIHHNTSYKADFTGVFSGTQFGNSLNCYYIGDNDAAGYLSKNYEAAIVDVTRVSEADAKSGKLCNMLNHYGSKGKHWYQSLGSEELPVVDFRHGIVEWDGENFVNRSRDNLEITYSTSDNEPVTLHGDFEPSELMGNYITIDNNDVRAGVIICDQPITMIGAYAFAQDSTLKAITLPESLVMVGNNAFGGCARLKEIVLGENVVSVGEEAFKGCSALKKAYVYAVQPPQCGNDAFDAGTTIYVIDPSLYKDAEGWQSLNIVGDADMMKAYKSKRKEELVQVTGASSESNIPTEIKDKYNEYAKLIDEATTVAAIEVICAKGKAELQGLAQRLSWKNKDEMMVND